MKLCIGHHAEPVGLLRQVCEYEAQLSSVKEAQAAAKAAAGGGQDLDQEVQEAFEEMNTQRAIYDKCACTPARTSMPSAVPD